MKIARSVMNVIFIIDMAYWWKYNGHYVVFNFERGNEYTIERNIFQPCQPNLSDNFTAELFNFDIKHI